MLAEHIAIHQPVTPPEKELVDQMAIARWRIRRFVAAETDLIDSEMAAIVKRSTRNSRPPIPVFTSPWPSAPSPMSLARCR